MGLSSCLSEAPITDSIPILILAATAGFLRSIISLLRPDNRHRSSSSSDGDDAATSAGFAGLLAFADFVNSNRAFHCEDSRIDDCAFCLCGMEEGERIRRLSCRHVFHSDCLDGWLDRMKLTCPLCRSPLLP